MGGKVYMLGALRSKLRPFLLTRESSFPLSDTASDRPVPQFGVRGEDTILNQNQLLQGPLQNCQLKENLLTEIRLFHSSFDRRRK